MPSFTQGSQGANAYAISARIAGRINASSVSRSEHEDLLRRRQALLDKLFDGSITKQERNALEYVRWSLDRIEDAQTGHELDRLEAGVGAYEEFRDYLESFLVHLNRHQQR